MTKLKPGQESSSNSGSFLRACMKGIIRGMKWFYHSCVILLLVLIAGELVARFGLGLGDPPLTTVDRQVGYLFAPNQNMMRFGNHVEYNAFSMRSDPFSPQKSNSDELRVMMIGDSVINGGSLTDQQDLASERLKRRLTSKLGCPVIVGNISAGGWSPSNELNYVKKFGLFDADIVILVVSSHDARGDDGFAPLNRDLPTRRPLLALQEGFTRYLPRWQARHISVHTSGNSKPDESERFDTDDLEQLIRCAQKSGAEVVVAQYPNRRECNGQWDQGHEMIRLAAESMKVDSLIELRPLYQEARKQGVKIYRDWIHMTADGQKVLADALEPVILDMVTRRTDAKSVTTVDQ